MPEPRSKRYDSEYARHYKQFEARRPNTVKAEQTRSLSHYNIHSNRSTPRAGLQSSQLGTIHEPPLQRKKIVPYDKNHNIFCTTTTKEERDREWLKRGDDLPPGTYSSHRSYHKKGGNGNPKSSVLYRSETPILAAEKKIFKEERRNRSPPVAGYVPDRIKRRSTYKNDYVNYQKKSHSRSKSKTTLRKSPHKPKVVGGKKDVSPDRLPPAGIRSATSFGDTRLLRPSDDFQYMRSPEREQPRIFDSEYTSHYTQPTKFKYVNGMWIEAPVTSSNTYYNKTERRQKTPDWFNQVIERRNEAYGYSQHARGTHFSRESLDEMNRERAERESSRSESQFSESPLEEKNRGRGVRPVPEEKYENPPRKREAWTEIKPRSPTELARGRAGSGTEVTSDDEDMVFLERGRSPTPELRESRDSRRHHLDVTTDVLNDSFHKTLKLDKREKRGSPRGNAKEPHPNSHPGGPTDEGNRKPSSPAPSGDLNSDVGSEAHKPLPPRHKVFHKANISPPDYGRVSPASTVSGRDDDVLSVSAMSSRASTASETLERARKRRDEFWKGESAR